MSEMKQMQGGNEDDAPRCPPHLGFVRGLCFLCGAKEEEEAEGGAPRVAVGQGGGGDVNDDDVRCVKEEDTEGGAPGVAVGYGMMKEEGDDGNDDDDARCVTEEDTEGGAPGVAVGYGMMKEEGDGDHGNDDDARCPPHEFLFILGLCCRCGATWEDAGGSASGVTVANIDEALVLPALAAATSVASASDMATLKRERKLILVLDLDHTLLNSTRFEDLSALEQDNGFTADTEDDLYMDLFRLEYSNVRMLVKLRPFVRRFLDQASPMFEMHVYTLGRQGYAKAIVDLLDPDDIYFCGRVVSRKESSRPDMKSLDVIPGADPAAVVILDDTDGVWPGNQDNLILMDRYHYFASTCSRFRYKIPSLAELLQDEREDDCSLAVVLRALKRIHQVFFDGDRADVREVIAELRRQVLPECTVVLDLPEDTLFWTLAERLGAVCRIDVDETVTHVVAEDPRTQKAQWAREHGKFLVSPEWIKAVSFRWCRVYERDFPVAVRAR